MSDLDKNGILRDILTWVNTPWKLIGLILSVIILGGAYTLYEYRDAIVQSYISQGNIALNTEKIPEGVEFIKEYDHIKDVYVWSVDLEANRRWLIFNTGTKVERKSYPLFTRSATQVQFIVDLLDAQISCMDIKDEAGELTETYKKSGNYLCAVAVPPYMGKFLGIIAVTMEEKPSEEDRREILARLKIASAKLTKRT